MIQNLCFELYRIKSINILCYFYGFQINLIITAITPRTTDGRRKLESWYKHLKIIKLVKSTPDSAKLNTVSKKEKTTPRSKIQNTENSVAPSKREK